MNGQVSTDKANSVLLHCCCAPCTLGSLPQFAEAGYEVFGYFYNPNIHPYQEHKQRRNAFGEMMSKRGILHQIDDEYPLQEWLAKVALAPEKRCAYCYESRLRQTAVYAKKQGFPAFSSTLLISPYQNHEMIRQIGQKLAVDFGLDFVYLDLRKGFRSGQNEARSSGIYMQKYCGCIYSEQERYCKQKSKESRGD